MVIRRKGGGPGGSEPPGATPDTELMEHLVKKSLDINPNLRDGKATNEVMDDLRAQVLARSRGGGAAPAAGGSASAPAAKPKGDLSSRRKSTISFFFEQKAAEFEEEAKELLRQEEELRRQRAELNERYADELTDFLGLMSGGESPEAREVIREFRKFLADIDLNEAALLKRMGGRR